MNIFKKIAVFVVTANAKYVYKTAINLAEDRREDEGREIFVIQDPQEPRSLLALTDKEYCKLRHILGVNSKAATIANLRKTCWYHTTNQYGNGAMTDRDKEVRKRAFIKDSLILAKLIKE